MQEIHRDKILIIDFGSQYTQLIARSIRELGVYCEIYPSDMPSLEIKKFAPQGIILSGGPQTVTTKNLLRAPHVVFELGCPVLGICYGMQTMTRKFGGIVVAAKKREFGYARININPNSLLFAGLARQFVVWMSHGDIVKKIPAGFRSTGKTDNTLYAAIEDTKGKFYGLQFHPEVTHTEHGKIILKNFVRTICRCKQFWTTHNILVYSIKDIQQKVGNERVLLALSGGVDSAVTALLLHKALGKNLICVFVDTGLLRYREKEQVEQIFSQHFHLNIIYINAKKQFLRALVNVTSPEAKRKIIGREFIKVFTQAAKKMHNIRWLAQGTIYPDVVESAHAKFKRAGKIKSHHNVGGLPQKMALKLIEPLRELFKDEVRKIGLKLGLPSQLVYRHPFPGPGLGVRIMGPVKTQYVNKLRVADNIFLEELERADLYHKVSQAFALFLPVKSVGVMGDQRQYGYTIALRAVTSIDFMTAQWAYLPHKFLAKVSGRIVNEIPGISRVVYDITGKPPATIEWE